MIPSVSDFPNRAAHITTEAVCCVAAADLLHKQFDAVHAYELSHAIYPPTAQETKGHRVAQSSFPSSIPYPGLCQQRVAR